MPAAEPWRDLGAGALEVARSQLGVRETSRNRGPEVDRYIEAIGLNPDAGHYSWCAAFAFWCWLQASQLRGGHNPIPRRSLVVSMWTRAGEGGIAVPAWSLYPLGPQLDDVIPGAIWCRESGGGHGHCGIVAGPIEVVAGVGARFPSIEGNTDPSGGREGDGVYERTRDLAEVNLGFIVPRVPR